MRYASGDNFTIDVEDEVAICRLFTRGDLDDQAVSRCAVQLLAHARALTLNGNAGGMVLDVRRLSGEQPLDVMKAYGQLAAAWERTAQRIAFLTLDDPVQKLAFGSIVQENASRFGGLHTDRNAARRFAGATAVRNPNTVSHVFEAPSRSK